jgi:hypothetical protein
MLALLASWRVAQVDQNGVDTLWKKLPSNSAIDIV